VRWKGRRRRRRVVGFGMAYFVLVEGTFGGDVGHVVGMVCGCGVIRSRI
jgi:hypothetical protein